jgi:hypothetical protein
VLVELRLWDGAEGELGNVHLRWAEPGEGVFHEIDRVITSGDIAPAFEGASPELRLAACVAETAEVLRGSHWARERDLDEVLTVSLDAADGMSAESSEVLEFLDLLARARDLQNRGAEPGAGG